MIIGIYKPLRENDKLVMHELLTIGSLYNKGSQRYKIVYKCDSISCKTPNRIYSITREHLSEKRSKTVNDKIQICRTCQTTGSSNPRYGDNRTWNELFDIESSDKLRKNLSDRNRGNGNPSKCDNVKLKKGQIIINFENVDKYLNNLNFKLNSIDGDNKFAKLNIKCLNGHDFDIQWTSFRVKKICRYCYYDSMRIPFDEIEIFETYSKTIRSMTRFTFNRNIDKIENSELKVINSRDYHIDHIYSISDGFINNIDPKIISSYVNLRVLSKSDNLKKGRKSDILLEELYERYNSSNIKF